MVAYPPLTDTLLRFGWSNGGTDVTIRLLPTLPDVTSVTTFATHMLA